MAVHSQSLNVPFCPDGWQELWIGYTFAMVNKLLQNIVVEFRFKAALFHKACVQCIRTL